MILGRAGFAWREARANVRATPVRFAVLAILIAAVTATGAWREATLTQRVHERVVDRLADGEFVFVVSGSSEAALLGDAGGSPTGVEGWRCDRLTHHPGVTRAGGVQSGTGVTTATHPSGRFSSYAVSPAFTTFLGDAAAMTVAEVIVGSGAAVELGVESGARLTLVEGSAATATVVPPSPLAAGFERSILTLSSAAAIQGECYVEMPGLTLEEATLAIPALLGVPSRVTYLLDRSSLGLTPEQVVAERPDSAAWLALAALPLGVAVVLGRSRRGESAAYVLMGATPRWAAWARFCEFLVVSWLAPVVSTIVLLWTASAHSLAALAGMMGGARQLLAILLLLGAYALMSAWRARSAYESLRAPE